MLNLAKFSLSRSFLYPHSLFFSTALKKPNGETSLFSNNFLKNKKAAKKGMGGGGGGWKICSQWGFFFHERQYFTDERKMEERIRVVR